MFLECADQALLLMMKFLPHPLTHTLDLRKKTLLLTIKVNEFCHCFWLLIINFSSMLLRHKNFTGSNNVIRIAYLGHCTDMLFHLLAGFSTNYKIKYWSSANSILFWWKCKILKLMNAWPYYWLLCNRNLELGNILSRCTIVITWKSKSVKAWKFTNKTCIFWKLFSYKPRVYGGIIKEDRIK